MGKLKTNKGVAKRFKITKTGKVKKVCCGQDHFNARETGNTKRNKRKDGTARKPLNKSVKALINKAM
jgi:large subunit ribosomal protein L35